MRHGHNTSVTDGCTPIHLTVHMEVVQFQQYGYISPYPLKYKVHWTILSYTITYMVDQQASLSIELKTMEIDIHSVG